jgi:hypothetical protein
MENCFEPEQAGLTENARLFPLFAPVKKSALAILLTHPALQGVSRSPTRFV